MGNLREHDGKREISKGDMNEKIADGEKTVLITED